MIIEHHHNNNHHNHHHHHHHHHQSVLDTAVVHYIIIIVGLNIWHCYALVNKSVRKRIRFSKVWINIKKFSKPVSAQVSGDNCQSPEGWSAWCCSVECLSNFCTQRYFHFRNIRTNQKNAETSFLVGVVSVRVFTFVWKVVRFCTHLHINLEF